MSNHGNMVYHCPNNFTNLKLPPTRQDHFHGKQCYINLFQLKLLFKWINKIFLNCGRMVD